MRMSRLLIRRSYYLGRTTYYYVLPAAINRISRRRLDACGTASSWTVRACSRPYVPALNAMGESHGAVGVRVEWPPRSSRAAVRSPVSCSPPVSGIPAR